MTKTITLLSSILILITTSVLEAEVKVSSPITSHMVLQRNMRVPIWGTASPNERFLISFNRQKVRVQADKNGNWKTHLAPMRAGGPYEMKIKGGKNTISLKDILVGEVWICTGQSNMDFNIGQLPYNAEKEAKNLTKIRLINFDTKGRSGNWRVCTPREANNFSATGFFFGRELYQKLKVPIGLIEGALGGTMLETWMSPQAVKESPQIHWMKKFRARVVGENYPQIKNMMPFGIRGAIWYQGEMNGTFKTDDSYPYHFATMIKHWRKDWGQGKFPVLFVQLPNFGHPQKTPKDDSQRPWAAFRAAQLECLKVENTGMAVTIDIGMANDIHPHNKHDVGKRLALNARALVYGEKNLVYQGPIYKEMKIEKNKIRVYFDHVGSGLVSTTGAQLKGFAIAGSDMKFVWAEAEINGKSVVVSSPHVAKPKHVIYAWAMNPQISLKNKEGLPASPFRTWSHQKPNGYPTLESIK